MNAFGNALLIAMPIFYVLIFIEMIWAVYVKHDRINIIDSVSSVSSGFTNILKTSLGLTLVVISYPWLSKNFSMIEWESSSIAPYLITFLILDFVYYWMHRFSHEINVLWNHHVIHHSSEEFNLPCALRQTITSFTNLMAINLIPLAVLGIDQSVIAVTVPVHIFSQFWYHTRYIGKLGFLEHILVTPSHHRVHHAMNDVYMDKNYSAIFIVWDKLFGTFQEELKTEPCVYGMRRPARTWNPFIINFKHLWSLILDAWRTQNLWDKFRIWLMPTGWRPADVAEKYPLYTISKMEEFKKHEPVYSKGFVRLCFVHINILFFLVCFLFMQFGEIEKPEAISCGMLLLLNIFSFTSLMDKRAMGLYATAAVTATTVFYCIQSGDWFGLNGFVPFGHVLVSSYFLVIGLVFAAYYFKEFRKEEKEITIGYVRNG